MIAGRCKSIAAGLLLLNILHLSGCAETDEAVLIIRNVSLIDGTGRDIRFAVDLIIRDGKIAGVGQTLKGIDEAQVIDGNGRFVIAGLTE